MIKCSVQLSGGRYARGEMIFIVVSNVGDSSIRISKCFIESGETKVEKPVDQLLRPGESTTIMWDQYGNGGLVPPGDYKVRCVADEAACSSSFSIMP